MSNQDETLAGDNDNEKQPDDDQSSDLPDADSGTVMEPGKAKQPDSSEAPEDTVALPVDQQGHPDADSPDQTFALPPEDQTVVEDTSFGDPGTVSDLPAEEQGASPGSDPDDRTIVEPLSGVTPPLDENADDTTIAAEESVPGEQDFCNSAVSN